MTDLYGFRTYSETSDIEVDVTTRLTRVIHTEAVPASSSGTITIQGINPDNAVAIGVPTGVRPPLAWVIQDGVSWQTSSDNPGTIMVLKYGG